jgi:hypothetical protein
MKFTLFLTIASLLLLTSCSTKEYNDNGVRFTCPDGWSITEEKSMSGDARYILIETDGLNSSGIIILSWLPNGTSTKMAHDLLQHDADLALGTKCEYSEITPKKLNGKEASLQTYTGTLENMPVLGKNWVSIQDDRVYCIATYGAEVDRNENQPGVDSFLKSFKSTN